MRLVTISEHQASGVTGACSELRVENLISSYTAIRPGSQLISDAHTAGPTHVRFGPKADKSGRAWFVRYVPQATLHVWFEMKEATN